MLTNTPSFVVSYQKNNFKMNALPISPLHDLIHPEDPIGNHILSFVGDGEYRFVGGVCKSFKEAYSSKFPDKTMCYNMSTMKLAKFCWEEAPEDEKHLLRCLVQEQTWYYIVHLDDLNGEDWELLKWAKSTFGCSCGTETPEEVGDTGETCSVAVRNGQLDLLKLARKKGFKWNKGTTLAALASGHLEILQWALENGCPKYFDTCRFAAENGFLDILQYAHEKHYRWGEDTCRAAAENGHLEILQWLHGNGCPWDEDTCRAAAVQGHSDVWKWARENDCPFTSLTFDRLRAQRRARRPLQHHPFDHFPLCLVESFENNVTWDVVQKVIGERLGQGYKYLPGI
jgi:hypothetical protein